MIQKRDRIDSNQVGIQSQERILYDECNLNMQWYLEP